jgi:hypothetical protein
MSVSLPNEIWGITLTYLPLRFLLSVSLVSRAWQRFAFPYLYHTVSLASYRDLKQFAYRVTSDSDPMLSISAHIRALCVSDDSGPCTHDLRRGANERENCTEFQRLLGIILSVILPRLEEFNWDVPCLLNNTEVNLLLQTGCPNLRSLSLELLPTLDLHAGEIKSDA